jgi:hypothetical protein
MNNEYWKKKLLKRLYGWYKNVFIQILDENKQSISEAPIPAFHGGPSAFERFDAYYMGSGEGAQAFG